MYNVYVAGDLFDHKHIAGNYALARRIEKISNGMYSCVLPQDWEGGSFDNGVEIRNRDIKTVMEADVVLFCFDGVDLDSGTVVEFMVAKMLDIPAVLFRTDVRNGGYLFGDDWNLMTMGYPRCEIVKHCALKMYNDVGLDQMHETMAQSIVDGFDRAMSQKPQLQSYEEVLSAYRHVIKMCGGGLDSIMTREVVDRVLAAKFEKTMYGRKESDGTNDVEQL